MRNNEIVSQLNCNVKMIYRGHFRFTNFFVYSTRFTNPGAGGRFTMVKASFLQHARSTFDEADAGLTIAL